MHLWLKLGPAVYLLVVYDLGSSSHEVTLRVTVEMYWNYPGKALNAVPCVHFWLDILGLYGTLPSLNVEPDLLSLPFIFLLLSNSSHNKLTAVPQLQDLFLTVTVCLNNFSPDLLPPNVSLEPSSRGWSGSLPLPSPILLWVPLHALSAFHVYSQELLTCCHTPRWGQVLHPALEILSNGGHDWSFSRQVVCLFAEKAEIYLLTRLQSAEYREAS